MPKIITVTPNTAIDLVITTQGLSLGDTVMAENSLTFAAGKGVNVAKALESLKHPVTALGFVGQQSHTDFTSLNSRFLQTDFTTVSGKTRTNITLRDQPSGQETHIRTIGYTLTDSDCQCLITQLNAHTQTGDIVIVSGSLPPGASTDFYKTLIEVCHAQGARVFLDSSGAALEAAITAQPYLLKPNQHELETLMGMALNAESALIQAAQTLVAKGIQCVVVSRGREGALMVTEREILSATLMQDIDPISSIGCGDAMVAGLAAATLQQDDSKATLAFGVACGTANLFSAEPGRFDNALLANINHLIKVNSIAYG